jgi:soluble lytic murein transglycosylase-like protein
MMKLLGLAIFFVCTWILSLLPSDYELDQQMRSASISVTGSSYTSQTTAVELEQTKQREESSTTHSTAIAQHPEPVASSTTTSMAPENVFMHEVRCGNWAAVALKAGWPEERLELLLDDIIWDESRCQADATNGADHGLLQINWSTWGEYVESFGFTREDLYIPEINLWIGAQIAAKATDAGWRWCQPWDSSQVRRCAQ